MTVGDALRALVQQGRIARAWLPGMRAILDRGAAFGGPILLRRSDDGLRWAWPSDAETTNAIVDGAGEPGLTDPATVGCLLALLREAVKPLTPPAWDGCGAWVRRDPSGWHVLAFSDVGTRRFDGGSEGEAIGNALVWVATVGARGAT